LFLPKTNRKIIPRWRDFWTTAALGQLTPAATHLNEATLPSVKELEAREAWQLNPTVWHALDLFSSAVVLGDLTDPEVIAAARYLESHPDYCPYAAQRVVAAVLHPEAETRQIAESPHLTLNHINAEIHAKRRRLSNEPRNSILWIDLANLYNILGVVEKAQHAIDMSCRLAPDNRFVIRSSARFLVHIGENEKALRLLRTSDLNEYDPWIVAAEIGVSSYSNKDSRLLKLGRRMVESQKFSDFAKSELASAIATVELNEGNRRAAKKLFRRSLAVPTENSLAQAEWAFEEIGDLDPTLSHVDIPRNFESKVLYGYRVGDWDIALVNGEMWLDDQPFSSRPAGVVSNLYSSIYEKHEKALAVLNFSLNSNPGDRVLNNNLAFALINLDRLDEAQSVLKKTNVRGIDDISTVFLTATEGLYLFRTGLPQLGRSCYLDAIELATRKGNPTYAATAAIYMAMEEIRANTETKLQSYHEATQLASKVNEPYVQHLLSRLGTMAEVTKLPAPGDGGNAK
jgi:tetratricopeptide (TPR) repeat protein